MVIWELIFESQVGQIYALAEKYVVKPLKFVV